jgi:hypothetical protein
VERVIVLGSVFLPGFVMDPLLVALRRRGYTAEGVAPPFHGSVDAIAEVYASAARRSRATTAIAHSNAGNFAPSVAAGSAVSRVVFLDAALPPLHGGTWPLVPERLGNTLLSRAKGGLLPPWTRWWPEADVRSLFPDDATYERVDASAPSVPTSYLSARISAPQNWLADLTCSYVAFGDTYAEAAGVAADAGWPVRTLPLGHLGMLQDPDTVADAVSSI